MGKQQYLPHEIESSEGKGNWKERRKWGFRTSFAESLECWRNVSFVLSIHVLQGSDRGLLNDMIYTRQIL